MKASCDHSCGGKCRASCSAKTAAPSVPSQWSWHHAALLALREHLLEDHAARVDDTHEPLELHDTDEADVATDAYDHDLALTFLADDEHAIREIDAALRRIQEGTYGICEETGSHIPASRLRALPWTRWTREAAEKLEKQGLVRGLKLGLLGTVRDGAAQLESDSKGAVTEPQTLPKPVSHSPQLPAAYLKRPDLSSK